MVSKIQAMRNLKSQAMKKFNNPTTTLFAELFLTVVRLNLLE